MATSKTGYRAKKPKGIDTSGDVDKLTSSVVDLAKFVEDEFASVASNLQDILQLQISFVAPAKPRQGMVAYADGTHWNPGSGEGIYEYTQAGAWVPLFGSIGGAVGAILLGSGLSLSGQTLSEDTTLIGEIKWFPFTRAPNSNYKACDGSAVSRSTFATLLSHLIHSSAVTFTNGSANIVWTAHGFSYLNEPVKLYTTGTLPTNFSPGTPGTGGTFYYIKSIVDANTITLSATPGGTVITAGSAGSGVHTAVNAPWGDGDNSTTFNLPELRGEFVRSWDAQRGVDVGRGFGADQLDAFQGHFHTVAAQNTANAGSVAVASTNGAANQGFVGAASTIGTDGVNGTPRIATETRPRNQTLFPFIRVL